MTELFTDDATIVDRSTLERWAECPQRGYQASLVTLNAGGMAEIGTAVHEVVAKVVAQRANAETPPRFLAEMLKEGAEAAPANVQPQVVRVVRRSAWKLSRIIGYTELGAERHPDDLLRFDGGEGERSGQLASVLQVDKDNAITYTGELDLLCAGPSIHEVDLYDWKSGWKWYTASTIADAFQFQSYAWLIFRNFPSVTRVNVRVAMLGEGELSSIVPIDRELYPVIEERLKSAARDKLAHEGATEASTVPARPTPERCSICSVVHRCPMADHEGQEASNADGYLKRYAALTAHAARMKTLLTGMVREKGEDIVSDGLAFGIGKPKAVRAPACDIYEIDG